MIDEINDMGPPSTGSTTGRDGHSRNRFLIILMAAILAAVSVAVVISSLGLGYWTSLGPGAGFFPFWIGILMGASSSVWLIQALRGNPNVGVAAPADESPVGSEHLDEAAAPTGRNLPLWMILLSLVVVATLLTIIGFQLSMFLFLLFMLKVQGGRKWPISLIISFLGSFGVFALFTFVLQVPLPVASIEFLKTLGL